MHARKAFMLIALLTTLPAFAEPWYVDKDNASGIEDGRSWQTAFTTVQPAIDAAFEDVRFNTGVLQAKGLASGEDPSASALTRKAGGACEDDNFSPSFIIQDAAVQSPQPDVDRQFGATVALSGDTMVVGNGDCSQPALAYVFERSEGAGNLWEPVATLAPEAPEIRSCDGQAVAIDGDTIAVVATGVESWSGGPVYYGGAYIFERNAGGPSNWGQTAGFTASDAADRIFFRSIVAIDRDTVVIGGQRSVYVHGRNHGGAGAWGEVVKLLAGEGGTDFGSALAVSGNTIAVGAYQDDEAGNNAGAVHVFERGPLESDPWIETAKLIGHDTAGDDGFGFSVALEADILVAGAPGDPSPDYHDGAVYVYRRVDADAGSTWMEVVKRNAKDRRGNAFGASVSISGNIIAVGAPAAYDGESRTGVVCLLQREPGLPETWVQRAKLGYCGAQAGDSLGSSVSLDGTTVVAGAPHNGTAGDRAGVVVAYSYQERAVPLMAEVWVAEGTYDEPRDSDTGALMLSEGVAVYGGFAGHEGQRSERGWETHGTILDGSVSRSGEQAYHVVIGADYATLDGFVVTGGHAI